MSSWAKVIIAIFVFVVLLFGLGLIYVYSGAYNIAATDEHSGFVRWMLNTTQEQSVYAHADDVDISLPSDSVALHRGYEAYREMCVVCHGAPGQERGWIGKGLNPEPPDLSGAADAFRTEEIYWIIRHGIKMAGMPALEPTHSDEEIVELTAFVVQLSEMTEAEYRAWGGRADQEQATEVGDGHAHAHEH